MPVATTRTVALQGALGHLVDVQADVSQGLIRTTVVGRPDAGDQRGPRPVPLGPRQQRLPLAGHPAGHDPALARRPAQARSALRPGHRRGRGRGHAGRCRTRHWRTPCFLGELTLDGRLRCGARRAADGDGRAPCRGVRTRRRAGAPGRGGRPRPRVNPTGVRSLRQVVALLSGEEPPEAEPVPAAADGLPLLSWRGERPRRGASTSPTCSGMADAALRARGRRRRRPPPDAQRAARVRQDHAWPNGCRRSAARPRPRGGARADRDPLPGRGAPGAGTPILAPAAVPRAAPLHLPGRHCSAAAAAGCVRERSAGHTSGCCSSTSSRTSRPTSSRRCASRWRAGRSRSRGGSEAATFPAAGTVRARLQPVPVR